MGNFGFVVLVLACFGTVFCQEPEKVVIKEAPGPIKAKEGETKTFTCHINRGLELIISDKISWVHIPSIGNGPVILTEQGTLKDTASPNDYGISINYTTQAGNIFAVLTLKIVKAGQDGKFVCRVIEGKTGRTRLEQDVELVVLSDVKSVKLVFDGVAVTQVESDSVQRQEGAYGVSCTASGFSSEVNIAIYKAHDKLATNEPTAELDNEASKAAGARRYTATVTAMDVTLTPDFSGNYIRCVAKSTFSDAVPKTASLPVDIIALEPTIECDKNISQNIGDLYVKIKCEVDHPNIEVKNYSFVIGATGESIEQGNMTADYNEVTTERINSTATRVTLELYELRSKHVDPSGGASYFYLNVFTSTGNFREMAALYVRGTSSASKPAAFILVVLLSLLFSL